MAKTSTKKNATAPSMSDPGTSDGRPEAASRPRLTKTMVMKIILQLHNAEGSTIQSILGKLQRQSGGEGITRVQVKKAIQRLMDDRAIKEVAKDRFSDHVQTKGSAAQERKKSKTKTASTATKRRAGIDRNCNAADIKTRLIKTPAVATEAAGGNSSSDITSNIPQQADRDRDDGSAQKKLDNNCENPRASPFTCGSMMGYLPKESPMDTQCEADGTPRRVNETNTTGTSKMVKTGPAIYGFGPGAMRPPAFPKI